MARTTSDIDFLSAVPYLLGRLKQIAGKGSALHQEHKIYLDAVTVEKEGALLQRTAPEPFGPQGPARFNASLWLESYW